MPDDYSADIETTGVATVGGIVEGAVDSAGDRDWFAVEFEAGRTYTIDLRGSPTGDGTLSDPYLHGIYDENGNPIDGTLNDNGGTGDNSRVTFTASDAGTYYIVAGSTSSHQGTYQLEVRDTTPSPDDFGDTAATAGAIEVGGSVTGEIGAPRDFDWFALDAVAGHTYVIDLEGSGTDAGTLANPQLRGLFGAGSGRLPGTTYDLDGGEGLNSRMTWTASETGTVYVAVRGHKDDTGTYTLSVTDTTPQDDFGDTAATAGAIEVGGSVTGEIGAPRDFDWFALDAVAGRTYVIDLEGSETDAGTLADPQVRGLFNAGGRRLPGTTNDRDGGEGLNSRMTWTASETGTVYVAARGHKDDTGTYTLSVTDITPQAQEQEQEAANGSPVFGEASYAFELAENANGALFGIALGEVRATDPDGDAVTYSIVSGAAGRFAIDPETGALSYVGTGEDSESGVPSYELTVRASDGALHSQVTVTVTVTDIEEDEEDLVASGQDGANRAPQFASASYAFTLDENVAGVPLPVSLGLVGATDADGDAVTYSIVSGDAVRFAIDAATGALSYAGTGEDYESGTTSYDLTVRASDGAAHSDAAVTVFVGDVEEDEDEFAFSGQDGANRAPQFASPSYAFALDENVAGVPVPVSLGLVGATDADGDAVTYSIVSGDAVRFAIDAATGALSYAGTGEDYESGTTSYDLTVRASDGAAHSDVAVTVFVGDVEEEDEEDLVSLGQNASVSEPDGEDLPDDDTTTGVVAVGGSATGKVGFDGDRDWFKVTLQAGTTYQIDLEGQVTGGGTLWDPSLHGVYDSGGDFISGTRNNNGGTIVNSRVFFTPEDTGTHFVAASGNGNRKGTYTLSVTDITTGVTDDYTAGTTTSGTVTVGGSATGKIDYATDQDWFAVTLEANKTYRIDLEGSGSSAGTLRDPYLRGMYDANGIKIRGTTIDDGDRGNSLMYFTAEQGGTHYVSAGAGGGGTGTYMLSVTEIVDDYAAGTETSGTVTVGGSATGGIDFWHDRDWFAVTLEAGRTYRIDLEGTWTDAGWLWDPYLRGVYDTNSARIAGTTDDNGGVQLNSRVDFTADESGTHYVSAGAYGNWRGTYRLSVTDITDGHPDDYTAGTDTSGTVVARFSTTGEIEFHGDRDWFAVELREGTTYRIDLEGWWTYAGTLRDPYLLGIHDADGDLITGTANDDGGHYRNSQVTFTATADATYYVAAGAYLDGEGTYTLSVEEVM